jgi:hypothetical protein
MLFERSTYDRLVQESADAKDYANSISGVAPVSYSEPETELRLRPYAPRQTHDSGVHDRVRNFCMRIPREITREVTTVHLYEDNLRRVVDNMTMDEKFQRKTSLYTHDNTPFAIRSVVSREDTLNSSVGPTGKAFMVRKRDRIRISYEGLFIDLTTTTVTTHQRQEFGGRGGRGRGRGRGDWRPTADAEPTVRYEVEIEIPDIAQFSHEKLSKIIRTLFRVVRATEVPYPVSFYTMMAEFHNNTLAQESAGRPMDVADFDSARLHSRARTLKVKDLVYGGIVGQNVHYSVTPKADGVRTALMIHSTGVWMYMGNGMLNCLMLSRNFDDLHGTILDVETIPHENRTAPEAKRFQYFIIAFDTLSVSTNFSRGTTTVQSKNHDERMMIAETVVRSVEERLARTNPLLAMIRTKIFYYSYSVDQFFDSVAKARHLIESGVLPYKTDGLVFTPSNLKSIPYPDIGRIDLRKRVLSDYPDIVKYKKPEQLTIDFAVDVKNRQLFSSGGRNSLIPFTARNFNGVENVAWLTCEEQNIPKNAILEFEWRDEQFHPIRHRSDKEQPNRLDVARDNFERIHEGLSYETLGGLNGVLMFKYHNRIKSLLYTMAASARARLGTGKTSYSLLDLGSGEGGDLHKWASAGFTHVIAVEPSATNVASLRKRLAGIMQEGKAAQNYPEVDIVEVGAEDTDSILTCSMKKLGNTDAKVDVISAMLSASFFWKNDETFANVIRTIKRHSKKGTLFLILTINGQLIEELVSPSMREGIIVESPIVLGDITLDLPLGEWSAVAKREIGGVEGLLPHATGRSYHITFKGSKTVHAMEGESGSAQREYMVYIPQLTAALAPEFVMKSHCIANQEPLLLGDYRIASSLYSYAIYERIV